MTIPTYSQLVASRGAADTVSAAHGAPARTMSSLEIADLVESNHADVRRSIERIAERGVITLPPLAEVPNPVFGPKTIKVYHVGQRDSYIIVAQLSPEFTARLVGRWQELEARSAPVALPNFADPVAAARAWADATESKIKAETALALVAGGMSQRKAAAAAGVSLAGIVKALKRVRSQAA